MGALSLDPRVDWAVSMLPVLWAVVLPLLVRLAGNIERRAHANQFMCE